MKLTNHIKLIPIVVFLLVSMTLSMATYAHTGADRTDPRTNHSHPRYEKSGFQGASSFLDVTGSLEVDTAITLTLEIGPNEAGQAKIQEKLDQGNSNFTIDDFTNTISVSLLSLVEFEDVDGNGFTENDTIVSDLILDATTLEEVIFEENVNQTIYTVNSQEDGLFSMIIIVNTTDNIPHDWKWSVEIEYNFVQTDTKLAMIHDINILRGNFFQERYDRRGEHLQEHKDLQERRLQDDLSRVPLFMRWDPEAVVDGEIAEIEASRYNDYLALSMIQGDFIDYDPSIGIDSSSLDNLDQEIDRVARKFADQIFSARGILIVLLVSSFVLVVAKFKRN